MRSGDSPPTSERRRCIRFMSSTLARAVRGRGSNVIGTNAPLRVPGSCPRGCSHPWNVGSPDLLPGRRGLCLRELARVAALQPAAMGGRDTGRSNERARPVSKAQRGDYVARRRSPVSRMSPKRRRIPEDSGGMQRTRGLRETTLISRRCSERHAMSPRCGIRRESFRIPSPAPESFRKAKSLR